MIEKTTHRYSDEELQVFKTLIEDKLTKAHHELDYMRQQIIDINQNGTDSPGGDWTDDSSIHTELEMLNQMVGRQQQFIRNLDNALLRIQNKTYGICRVTGQLIDKKRLMLVPHATQSIAAKEGQHRSTNRKLSTKESRPPFPSDKRKTVANKIISKVLKKTPAKPNSSSLSNNDEWEEDTSFKDVPNYENPIMNIDLEQMEENDE